MCKCSGNFLVQIFAGTGKKQYLCSQITETMKRVFWMMAAVMMVSCCCETDLQKRAEELCQYVPDHELLERSKNYMTEDFYNVLDTMFHLPNDEDLAYEWLYYFVTGNGGTIADYEVTGVKRTDATHAVATVMVRQKWEDGSFDPETDIEEHRLYMERVGDEWLMSDFDEHKADCIRRLRNR